MTCIWQQLMMTFTFEEKDENENVLKFFPIHFLVYNKNERV